MAKYDFNAAANMLNKYLEQEALFAKRRDELDSHRISLENIVFENLTNDHLKELVETIKEQNVILGKQIDLLSEENAMLKEQIEDAKVSGEFAKTEAKKTKIFSWISFGVATLVSVAALIVSIIALA